MSEAIDFQPVAGAEGEIEHSTPEIFARHLVEWAIDRHASDLFVSDTENSVIVSVRRLGRIEVVRRLARDYGHRLQGYFRVLVGRTQAKTYGQAKVARRSRRPMVVRSTCV